MIACHNFMISIVNVKYVEWFIIFGKVFTFFLNCGIIYIEIFCCISSRRQYRYHCHTCCKNKRHNLFRQTHDIYSLKNFRQFHLIALSHVFPIIHKSLTKNYTTIITKLQQFEYNLFPLSVFRTNLQCVRRLHLFILHNLCEIL